MRRKNIYKYIYKGRTKGGSLLLGTKTTILHRPASRSKKKNQRLLCLTGDDDDTFYAHLYTHLYTQGPKNINSDPCSRFRYKYRFIFRKQYKVQHRQTWRLQGYTYMWDIVTNRIVYSTVRLIIIVGSVPVPYDHPN